MAIAVLNWNQKSIPERLIRVNFIINKMTENADVFPAPNPALSEVSDASEALFNATVNALAGGYELTYIKNTANDVLHSLMVQLLSYIQNVSGGDEGIIFKSGCEMKKEASAPQAPGQVENLSAFPSRMQQEIDLKWDTLSSARVFQVEMWVESDGGEGVWDPIATTTKSKFTKSGLVTGKVYRFRVAGIGSDDKLGPYSQEATSVAP